MTVRQVIFTLVCALAAGLALAIEWLSDIAWHGEFVVIYGSVLLLAALLGAAVVRPGARRTAIGVGALAVWITAVWLLPINPCERFARDVRRLETGMTRAEVERALAGHVAGTQLPHPDGGRYMTWRGATYYEPRRQHHSLDTYALLSWRDGALADVFLHLD